MTDSDFASSIEFLLGLSGAGWTEELMLES
jgi:hypothetical protein